MIVFTGWLETAFKVLCFNVLSKLVNTFDMEAKLCIPSLTIKGFLNLALLYSCIVTYVLRVCHAPVDPGIMFNLFFEASLFGIENKTKEKYIEQSFSEQLSA